MHSMLSYLLKGKSKDLLRDDIKLHKKPLEVSFKSSLFTVL